MTALVRKVLSMALLAIVVYGSIGATQLAEAHRGRGHGHHRHYAKLHHRGPDRYYDRRRNSWVSYKTGKIIKGGLVGAGIGAGTGLLMDRSVGKSALLGAGIGAGVQAIRYTDF